MTWATGRRRRRRPQIRLAQWPRRASGRSKRRDVAVLSLIICLTDVVNGMVAPTFSPYVESLGGSALVVGLLTATVGLTRLLGALPVGTLSDYWGRRFVLVAGLCLFAAACILFSVPTTPLLLILPRILFALAILATFPLGIAYIGDVVRPERRSLAVSAYVSAQGLGYALGPLLGSWLADVAGYEVTYRVAGTIALVTAAAARLSLRDSDITRPPERPRLTVPRHVLTRPIAAASLANGFMMLMFTGAVVPFLSLYAAGLDVSIVGVGWLYAARSAASMIARVPAGFFAARVSSHQLMTWAIAVDLVAACGIGLSQSPAQLMIAVVLDGAAYGVFLASSQSVVAERSGASYRGMAIGIYGTAGALGETVGAVGFAIAAHLVSTTSVFLLAGALLGGCLMMIRFLGQPVVEEERVYAPRADAAIGDPAGPPGRSPAG